MRLALGKKIGGHPLNKRHSGHCPKVDNTKEKKNRMAGPKVSFSPRFLCSCFYTAVEIHIPAFSSISVYHFSAGGLMDDWNRLRPGNTHVHKLLQLCAYNTVDLNFRGRGKK